VERLRAWASQVRLDLANVWPNAALPRKGQTVVHPQSHCPNTVISTESGVPACAKAVRSCSARKDM
jgi:hypothetical protein